MAIMVSSFNFAQVVP